MIKRDQYLNQLIANKNNGFPKVITGIRRCGKSYLLKEIYKKYLVSQGVKQENILIIELDDIRNIEYRNPISINEYIMSKCSNTDENYYVFIDEIQLISSIINPTFTNGEIVLAKRSDLNAISFVDVVLGISRQSNIDLYVTGSNSKMLSTDIITEFRDKAIEIQMGPLSFYEYYNYVQGDKTEALYEYMNHGGMPLAVLNDSENKEIYLKRLFETTYFKDIIERNNIHKGDALDELCTIISTCTGELINSEKIANTFTSKRKEKIDKDTIKKYIKAFEDAFIIREVKRYDIKSKNTIGATTKYYFCDPGLRNARLNFVFPDEGQMLENIVYNELIYNGFNVNVGCFDRVEKDKNGKSIRKTYEIDFYASKAQEKYYIQVSSNIDNLQTKDREVKPFILLNEQIRKILVINKPVKRMKDENGFDIIGITEFLLNLKDL